MGEYDDLEDSDTFVPGDAPRKIIIPLPDNHSATLFTKSDATGVFLMFDNDYHGHMKLDAYLDRPLKLAQYVRPILSYINEIDDSAHLIEILSQALSTAIENQEDGSAIDNERSILFHFNKIFNQRIDNIIDAFIYGFYMDETQTRKYTIADYVRRMISQSDIYYAIYIIVDEFGTPYEDILSESVQLLDLIRLDQGGAVARMSIDGIKMNLKFPSYQNAEETLEMIRDNPSNVNGILTNLVQSGTLKKTKAEPSHGIVFVAMSSGSGGTTIRVNIDGNKYDYTMQSRQAAERIYAASKKQPGQALNQLKKYVNSGHAECRKL